MVRLEKELWKFSEVKEVHLTDEANELLAKGWKLLEAGIVKGEKFFILGIEKPAAEKAVLDREIETVIEKREERIEQAEIAGKLKLEKKGKKSAIKPLILGPVFLALGLWLFFEVSPKKLEFFGIEYSLLENIVLFASVILIIAGLVNVFHHASSSIKKQKN